MRADTPVPLLMPAIFAIVVTIALSLLILAPRGGAQEALPDENLLALSCDYLAGVAAGNGFKTSNCRRVSEEISGNRAVERVSIKILSDSGPTRLNVSVHWMRSLWGSPLVGAE